MGMINSTRGIVVRSVPLMKGLLVGGFTSFHFNDSLDVRIVH